MAALFWISLFVVVYPYLIYPALLAGWNRLTGRRLPQPDPGFRPTVTVILPVHNEAERVPAKVQNLLSIEYPRERLQIIVIGDGCTDDSLEIAHRDGTGRVTVQALPQRAGKAAALNAGLALATGEIVVFTDAGILLEPSALATLVDHFANPSVGCVSGEDHIEGGSTEGLYGRFELLLRREEARLHSIAGASGCFYGIRRSLCQPFRYGMAPDFLSVLDVVRSGHRAVCEPKARGAMTATVSTRAELSRKTRTLLRGITALFGNAALLNPFRFPTFSFVLVSHKLLRWLAPIALASCLVTAFLLRGRVLYEAALYGQGVFYTLALAGLTLPALAARSTIIRLSAFFVLANLAAAKALWLWSAGIRQELWEPTRRPA